MRIVLHIGTEKTATTSIQKNLFKHREAFAKQRVLYPERLSGENHLCLPACAAGDPKMDEITAAASAFIAKKGYEDMNKYVVDTVEEQIGRINPDLIIFSNEHLHSRVKDIDGVERLRKTLAKLSPDITIVVYIRRQDRLAVSFFSTPYKYGLSAVRNAIPTVSDSLPYYYDYGKLVTNWADVFGTENVIVKVFEEETSATGGIFGSFLGTAGVANPPPLKITNHNESLSLEAVHFLARFNEEIASLAGKTEEAHKMRTALVRFLETHYPSRQRPASKEMARRFYDACRPSNDIVLSKFFPDRKLLFDENFEEYGGEERLVPNARTIAEIGVKVALRQSGTPKALQAPVEVVHRLSA